MIYVNILCVAFFVLGLPQMINSIIKLKEKGAKIYDPFITIIECYKCTTFWVALAMSGSFFVACQLSVIAYIVDKYIISKY